MVGDNYLRENYWKYLSEVIIMMYHTAKLYSDMGKNVLIDGILVEREEIKPHYHQLLEILKDNPLDIVEVYFHWIFVNNVILSVETDMKHNHMNNML